MSGATLTYPGSGYEAALDLGSAEIRGGVFLNGAFRSRGRSRPQHPHRRTAKHERRHPHLPRQRLRGRARPG